MAWPRHGGQGLAVNRQQEAQSRDGPGDAEPGEGVDAVLTGPTYQTTGAQAAGERFVGSLSAVRVTGFATILLAMGAGQL